MSWKAVHRKSVLPAIVFVALLKLYNNEVDLCFVELGCMDVCKVSEPFSGNQAVGFIANFYALVLTLRSFQSPQSDTQNFRPPSVNNFMPLFVY